MTSEKETMEGFFRCTESERASFEAGIKLGALFHQFVGVPLSLDSSRPLEEAMTLAVMTQPYVVKARVRLDRRMIEENLSHFGYCSLEGRMMDAYVEVKVGRVKVTARLRHVDELKYPLMWIDSVEQSEG